METKVKRNGMESSVKVEITYVVRTVTTLLKNLNELNMMWFSTYNNINEHEDIPSTMLYSMRRSYFDPDEVRIATLEPSAFQRLYLVRADKPFLSESNDLEGRISLLDITSGDYGQMATYLFKRKDATVLGVADIDLNQYSTIFEYPPRSFASVLFFMVNPEVEKYLRDLSRRYLTSKEDIEMLDTWEYVYDRVRETKVERDVSLRKKPGYRNALDSVFSVCDSPRYKVLSSIGIRSIGEGETLQKFYTVGLKKVKISSKYFKFNEINPEYLMSQEHEMVYLLKRLLPRSDVVALSEDASTLLQMVRKVPILIKVLEQLDNEWFTKPVNQYNVHEDWI
ncbi:MAG: hypothetical protein QXH21_07330 [Ignisphaera sp.]